jgi:hypothetical protein
MDQFLPVFQLHYLQPRDHSDNPLNPELIEIIFPIFLYNSLSNYFANKAKRLLQMFALEWLPFSLAIEPSLISFGC